MAYILSGYGTYKKIVGTIEGPTKENDSHDWPFQNKPVGG